MTMQRGDKPKSMSNTAAFRPEHLSNILFLDIETVSQKAAFSELTEEWKALWQSKAENMMRNMVGETPESLYHRAAIHAEFGKVVCISCGIIKGAGSSRRIVVKSYSSHDERGLLVEFSDMVERWGSEPYRLLCAHNGKEFDFPYLCRRMTINGLALPRLLQISGKKPWEIPLLDTMEMWKFGDFKSYTSLNLLAHSLGVPSPKDDLDGSKVGGAYWVDQDLPRITAYCEKDVYTLAQVFLRLIGDPMSSSLQLETK